MKIFLLTFFLLTLFNCASTNKGRISNSGDIIFTTRNATWINSYWEPSLTGYDDLNSFEKRFRPQQCGIFLFPAHLDHYVTPSHSEEERYSISFNYNLEGKFFGDCNNHLTLKVL